MSLSRVNQLEEGRKLKVSKVLNFLIFMISEVSSPHDKICGKPHKPDFSPRPVKSNVASSAIKEMIKRTFAVDYLILSWELFHSCRSLGHQNLNEH
jgi:hypothetical protein